MGIQTTYCGSVVHNSQAMEIIVSRWARVFSSHPTHRIRNDSNSYTMYIVSKTTHLILEYHQVHHVSFSLARIATKDRPQLGAGTLAFSNHALALSPVDVDVGKLSPRKNKVISPNSQPLFVVEIHTIGQIVNSDD